MLYAFHTASNYDGTVNALNGCMNDWRNYLVNIDDHFGVPQENRQSYVAKNYRRELVVAQAKLLPGMIHAGDTLIYSNSSHGTDMPDQDGDEVDGYDEALYTDDGKFISDDEIHQLMTKFIPGCLVMGFFDNCRAGTMDRNVSLNWHSMPPDVKCHAVFFFGCVERGTSADAYINGRYEGAFSHFLFQALFERKYELTYLELLTCTNELLRKNRYRQVGQMACTPGMENLKFGTMPNV